MADHTIAANFMVESGAARAPEALRWTHFFKNFNLDPDGRISIKNFHPE